MILQTKQIHIKDIIATYPYSTMCHLKILIFINLTKILKLICQI